MRSNNDTTMPPLMRGAWEIDLSYMQANACWGYRGKCGDAVWDLRICVRN